MIPYHFQIAGVQLQVESDFVLERFFELEPYRVTPANGPVDVRYHLGVLPEDWVSRGSPVYEDPGCRIMKTESEIHRYYFWRAGTKDAFVLLRQPLKKDAVYDICLREKDLASLLPRLRLAAFLGLEQVLLEHDVFQLHASVIALNGQGILFCAPSGTGKSTQAELWHRLRGAEILNGDRGMIRRFPESFQVYGSPYAGSSEIYTNLRVPIRALVVLSQAPQNHLERLEPGRAFAKLFRECTVPSRDEDTLQKVTELLTQLINRVPIYHLACRPDSDAVELLYEAVFGS